MQELLILKPLLLFIRKYDKTQTIANAGFQQFYINFQASKTVKQNNF